ncbi:ABC transporter permease [Haloechinothrix halophila]|uniref:ABC transporter permease n=1 Tax=Haloechinothrix halophila TaxID=1069073 RepID=UPI00040DFE6D|nr:ABC transporter permease [Haloechinothrix halophila]
MIAGWPITRLLLRRLGQAAVTLLIASVLIFGALAMAPGDPAASLAGGTLPSPDALAMIRAQYHLDEPWPQQYLRWLAGAMTGDFGQSMVFRADVSALLSSRLGNTALLIGYAGSMIVVIGVGLGVVAALRGHRVRTIVTVLTTVAMGAPTFVVAIALIWLFSTQLDWFPIYGSGEGLFGKLEHLTLPAIALSLSFTAYVAHVTRVAVAAERDAEHVDTARSRGIPGPLIVRRHILRNAGAPILTVSGLSIAGLFAGTAVAEQAFGVNGLGSLLVEAAAKQDMAVVQATSLLMVTAFVLVNTLVDLVNVAIDPRAVAEGSAR